MTRDHQHNPFVAKEARLSERLSGYVPAKKS